MPMAWRLTPSRRYHQTGKAGGRLAEFEAQDPLPAPVVVRPAAGMRETGPPVGHCSPLVHRLPCSGVEGVARSPAAGRARPKARLSDTA